MMRDRFTYDAASNVLFIDFSGLRVDSSRVIREINDAINNLVGPLGHRVYAVVDYNDFSLESKLDPEYGAMMRNNQERYSLGTVRYSSGLYTRTVLRGAAVREKMLSNVCQTRQQAVDLIEKMKRNSTTSD